MTETSSSKLSTSAQSPKLSSSVAIIVSKFSDVETVSAGVIVNSLLELHGDSYAGGRGATMRVTEDSGSLRRPMLEWMGEIEALYDRTQIEQLPDGLNGRLVILGLSRLDTQLTSQLVQNNFLEILKKEHTPPFEALLSPQGR
jgi:hypothetical protein